MRAHFAIAGEVLAIEGAEHTTLDVLASAFAPFATAASPTRTVRCHTGGVPFEGERRMPAFDAGVLRGEDFEARRTRDGAELFAAPGRLPVELTLKLVLAEALLARGGVLVHGVAASDGTAAALFSGPSGAGKSTLGANARDAGLEVLGDELVALVPDGARWRAHGTPWNLGTAGQAPLVATGLLAWGPPAFAPLTVDAASAVWLKNVVVPEASPEVQRGVTRAVLQVLGAVPRLRFSCPDDVRAGAAVRALLVQR